MNDKTKDQMLSEFQSVLDGDYTAQNYLDLQYTVTVSVPFPPSSAILGKEEIKERVMSILEDERAEYSRQLRKVTADVVWGVTGKLDESEEAE